MKTNKWIVCLLALGLLLSACGGNVPTTEDIPAVEDIIPPQVAAEIQNQVSELLGVAVENIQIQSIEQMNWPDSCLGLPEEGEACTQAVTPGWLIVFSINGEEFRFRTDETGTVIRQEP